MLYELLRSSKVVREGGCKSRRFKTLLQSRSSKLSVQTIKLGAILKSSGTLWGDELTVRLVSVTEATPKPAPSSKTGQHFDAASFIGGMILMGGLIVIIYFGLKFYRARRDRNYRTLWCSTNQISFFSFFFELNFCSLISRGDYISIMCLKFFLSNFKLFGIFFTVLLKKRERLGAWIFFKLNFEIITMKPKLFEVFTRQVPVSMFLKVYFCRSFCSIEIMVWSSRKDAGNWKSFECVKLNQLTSSVFFPFFLPLIFMCALFFFEGYELF